MLDLLDSGGWWHAPDQSDTGPTRTTANCMMTALYAVTVERDTVRRVAAAMAAVIREQFPERLPFWAYDGADYLGELASLDPALVVNFNDHRDTFYDDVRMVLEKVAV
jgi:hypothetical protein